MTSYPPPPRKLAQQPDISSSRTTATPPPLPTRSERERQEAHEEHGEDDSMDVISYWAIGAGAWLLLLAAPLLLFPRILVFLAQSSSHASTAEYLASSAKRKAASGHYDDLSPLESYLCTQLGVGILAVVGMAALLIPTPPAPPLPGLSPSSLPSPLPTSLRQPFLLVLSSLLALSGLLSYNSAVLAPGAGFGLSSVVGVGNGVVGIWGWWVAMFGQGSYRSRKTGADKRTSRFPFYNKKAASVQKAEWKKTH